MAIKLIANYSKRLGLPGYSSHQFEVSVQRLETRQNSISPQSGFTARSSPLWMPRSSRSDLFLMLPMVREVHPVRRFLPCGRFLGFLCLRLRIPRHLTPKNRYGIVRKSRSKSSCRWHVKTGSTIPHFMIWPYSVSAEESLS